MIAFSGIAQWLSGLKKQLIIERVVQKQTSMAYNNQKETNQNYNDYKYKGIQATVSHLLMELKIAQIFICIGAFLNV